MEVGAVKQAYNNEVIHLKKKLNQAKIQIIHKLTRKAKTLKEKKAPDKLKEKLNNKAESAVKEVLLIKKITAKHLARFALTHEEELKNYLNRPTVDSDKACARLLLHKTLQDKYTFLRSRFSNIPIKDLFMSRQERLKSKKEAKESQNKINKGAQLDHNQNTQNENETISTRDDWKVEDVAVESTLLKEKNNAFSYSSDEYGDIETDNGESIEESLDGNDSALDFDNDQGVVHKDDLNKNDKVIIYDESNKISNKLSNIDMIVKTKKLSDKKNNNNVKKSCNKNKKVSDKFQQKRSNIISQPMQENRIVDPFFITSTGENYMSLVEPRPPDEVKEVHKQGNRKHRRAIMFGHVPKFKRKDQNLSQNDQHQKNGTTSKDTKFSKPKEERKNGKFTNSSNRNSSIKENDADKPPEKLHPSWEAKKRLSSIQPFQGKKIVFD